MDISLNVVDGSLYHILVINVCVCMCLLCCFYVYTYIHTLIYYLLPKMLDPEVVEIFKKYFEIFAFK